MNTPRISIIGLGQVGRAFLHVLSGIGYSVISAINNTPVSDELRSQYASTSFLKSVPETISELGDLTFITVPDDAISLVAAEISNKFDDLSSRSFVHCSGALSSHVLHTMNDKGAATASFHPNQSITTSTQDFSGTWFDVEGEKALVKSLSEIADQMNAHVFEIESTAKPYLHASAVIASNYLVVLADLMTGVSAQGNISEEQVLKALIPLMRNTINNIETNGVDGSLTGPIARRDVNTVSNHVELLASNPELLNLYKQLGIKALRISARNNSDQDSFDKLKKLLS